MNKEEKLRKLKLLKKELKKEGFIIDGIVGSFIDSNRFNDINIVYHLNERFINKYKGWNAFIKLEEIKSLLKKNLESDIDLIDRDYTNNIMKKVIQNRMLSV